MTLFLAKTDMMKSKEDKVIFKSGSTFKQLRDKMAARYFGRS